MTLDLPESPTAALPADSPAEPVNLLLVDDELNNLKALEAVLAAPDRKLVWAQSGEEALRWLLKEQFAVVLLDVHMPGMDGFETAALIRQHVRLQSTPIIFLTAALKEYSHVTRGYALGAVDYILKPLDIGILRSKVAVFVELYRKSEQVRHQAEQLTEARAFLQNVLESTTDYAIIAQDLKGTVFAWYEGARQLYGYSAEEMVGKQSARILFEPHEIESGRLQELLRAALREGRAEGVFEHVRRDGHRFTALVGVNPWKDAQPGPIGYILVVKDITEQQVREEQARLLIKEQAARAEAEAASRRFAFLAEASRELGRMLDDGSALQRVAALATQSLADACVIDLLDDTGRVQTSAASHRDSTKQSRLETLAGSKVGAQLAGAIVQKGESVLLPEVSAAKLQEHGLNEEELLSPLRSLRFTSAMIIPIPGQRGLPSGHHGALCLFRVSTDPYDRGDLDFAEDLARRVGLALDNVRLYQEAQEAVHMREEFLSVASHELKTPVTSLQGQAQLMIRQLQAGRELEPARLERAFRVVDSQTHKLSRLVSQLLDISRLQAGKLALERSHADIPSLVQGVVTSAQATTNKHEIELRAPAEVMAEVDSLRLEQVVTNLLDNAIKFSPEGGRIQVEVTCPSDDRVRIAVRDWGVGIPREHRTHIFDRFHQGPMSSQASGMGLGLYISRQIVELHGGKIEAQFPRDGGTRFVVTLPMINSEADAS